MFERYTEKARRVVFYARYETSELGYEYIESDFLLLALARESPDLTMRWLGMNYQQLRDALAPMYTRNKRIATSVDLPLSEESRRVLAYAGEEADRLGDQHIGTEHLFLGLVREGGTAKRMLKARHEDLNGVRKAIAKDQDHQEVRAARSHPASTGLQMKLLAEDGREIAMFPWQGQTPRIGEVVRIPGRDGAEFSYRILDLCWSIKDPHIPNFRDSEILLTVREEDP